MADKNNQGEWIDQRGRAVPAAYVPKIDKERDKVVEKIFREAERLQKRMQDFKEQLFKDVEKYLELLEKEVGAKGTDWKGNLTLTNFSGNRQIEIAINEMIGFDERLNIAKSKIDNCLKRWSGEANRNIQAIINEAFNVDKKGRINTTMVLKLTKLKIRDAEWNEAMKLIKDSIQINGSRRYVNIRRRTDNGMWQTLNLNFSSI